MDKKTIRFNRDGKFRILMVSDFHEKNRECGSCMTDKFVETFDVLVENTKPDLVLIGGDQRVDAEELGGVREHMEYMISPLIKRGIPWAAVFGNHDRECTWTLEEEMEVYSSLPGCLAEAGPEDVSGIGNYCLEILSSKDDSVAYHVFALDTNATGGRLELPAGSRDILPHYVTNGNRGITLLPDQVFWYYNESLRREQAAGKKIPAIMYMHIPLPELCIIERNPEETGATGIRRELVEAPEMNSGMFMACLQRGDVRGIFFGHEHLNNFAGKYCGITLGYDGGLSYNTYTHDTLRGGRVIDLSEDGSLTTHNVTLMELMGNAALRDPSHIEGEFNYSFRVLPQG